MSLLALSCLGIGYAFAFRVETALAFQERYAEMVSSRPPSEDPEYYEATHEHRQSVLQLGGVVLLAVGALLLAATVYGTLFVESFPQ